jgi:hypothetical protein
MMQNERLTLRSVYELSSEYYYGHSIQLQKVTSRSRQALHLTTPEQRDECVIQSAYRRNKISHIVRK